jgi:hypothetical protein
MQLQMRADENANGLTEPGTLWSVAENRQRLGWGAVCADELMGGVLPCLHDFDGSASPKVPCIPLIRKIRQLCRRACTCRRL